MGPIHRPSRARWDTALNDGVGDNLNEAKAGFRQRGSGALIDDLVRTAGS